jgi:hypothetical protein
MTKGQPMHTEEEVHRAAKFFEEADPSKAKMVDTDLSDLRAVAEAADQIRADEARLLELVEKARENGRSWARIGIALGVSRQAARERFSEKVRA